jgi:hypothetical protein
MKPSGCLKPKMAYLFQVTRPNVNVHVKNVFAEGELKESVVKDYLSTAADGKGYQTKFYNLTDSAYLQCAASRLPIQEE